MTMLVDVQVRCPHCGAQFTLEVDTSQGDWESIEDCEICCCPLRLNIKSHPGEVESLTVEVS